MKIGIFRRKYLSYGGGERFTQRFVEGVVTAGHEVHLFCQEWANPPKAVTTHRVPTLPGGSALRTLSYALLAPRLAQSVGMTLVHSFERTFRQELYRAGEGCHRQWLALGHRHWPGALRALDQLRPFHRVTLSVERRICQQGGTNLLIVNSRMVQRDFARHYVPLRASTVLIRNGVDIGLFHPDVRARTRRAARETFDVAPDHMVLLTVGSGFSRKGVPTVVRALGHLRRESRLAPIALIAGRGHPAPVRALATREGVERQLRFLGIVEDTLALYSAADLFVLPSLYDPASSATLEALAMGLPVITTRRNGTAELIDSQRSGWLLEDPTDSRGLASLIEAAADLQAQRSVGEAGRKAVEPWTWGRHLSEALALYSGFARQ